MSHKSSKTAEEKLAIVLEGLKGGITVSDLCRKYGLSEEEFISSMKQEGHSVSLICKMLRLPQSSYYRKRSGKTTVRMITDKKAARIEQEASLLEKIKEVKLVISVSYNRVYRIMKKNDLLVDRKRYKAKRTPQKDKPKPVKINQWWGTDMTKFYVQSFGWVYLVIVLDWYSKKIVGFKP